MAGSDRKDYILDEIKSIEDTVKDVSNKLNSLDKTMAEYKISFDHHIAVDEQMYHEFKRMNDILQQNTESLKQHMRRTDLNEEAIQRLGTRLTDLEIRQIESEAVKKWFSKNAVLAGKILGALVALGTLAMMLPDLIKWLIR